MPKKIKMTLASAALALFAAAFCGGAPACAASHHDPQVPMLGSIKAAPVNVRSGPGTRYPILWVYKRPGWPVEVTATFEMWYKIRDLEGEEGWMARTYFSSTRTVVVNHEGGNATLYRTAEDKIRLRLLEPGVILRLESCSFNQCKVAVDGVEGWVARSRLRILDMDASDAANTDANDR